MKHSIHLFTLFLLLCLGHQPLFADDDTGDVSDEESALMAGKKVNAPTWQETDPSQSTDPTQTRTPYLNKRRALVGYNCQINRIITTVGVGAWTNSLTNLVDDDLDNNATFPGIVGVTAAVSPIVGVRDLDNYYAAGTTVGFCVVANSGTKVLSLDVIKTMHIWLYCDGKRVDDLTVREGNAGSGVKLSLIGVGNDAACVNLTAKSTKKFDEVVLVKGGGVDAEVGGVLQIKYAFVGDPHDILLTTNGVADYCTETGHPQMNVSCDAYMPSPLVGGIPLPVVESYCQRAIDDDLTNTVPLVSAVQLASVAFKGRVRVNVKNSDRSVGELFNAGDQVGFKYNFVQVADVLQLGTWVDVKLYDHNGDETETITVSAEGLALAIASGGDQTSYVEATKPFSGAEISFYTGLGVLNLGSGFGVYYGFVRPKPSIEKHHCPINASYGVNTCDQQSTYQLRSNEQVAVTWTLIDAPTGSAVTVDANGYVRNLDEEGDYTFRATADDGCYEEVTIHHGITGSELQCEIPFDNRIETKYALSTEEYGTSGALISFSELQNPDNTLDGDPTTFATYNPEGTLADNLMIVGVKTVDDALIYDGSKAGALPMRIGYVVEMESTGLDLNLLNFINIRCYNGTGNNKQEVYRGTLTELGIIGIGIAGEKKDEKVRLAIKVPPVDNEGNPIKFNEFQLWKSGVGGIAIDKVDIFYPFFENVSSNNVDGCGNPIMEGSDILTYHRDHAYVSAENIGAVAVGDVTNNLSNIVDDDPNFDTYATIVKGAGSGQTVISVKMGHIQDFRQQVGVVIDNTQYVDVALGDVMTLETYMNGEPTGEKENEWKAIGVNVVQNEDKVVLLMNPSKEYDEIRLSIVNGLGVAKTFKIYGIILRNDIDHDGISDLRDNDNCSNTINDIQVTNTCLGGTLHLQGQATTETDFYFIIPDQVSEEAGNVQGERFDVRSSQTGEVTVDIHANKVGYQMPIYIYDGSDKLVGTASYNVHPLQTTWKKNPSDANWNEWSNWTNGTPYLCTDVIIPNGAAIYPSLDGTVTRGDEFGCARIQFESRAAVEKVFKLNYTQAFVDIDLLRNRYYLLSAPLQNMYTGDMFVATTGDAVTNPTPWQELTGTNYQQNRFSPRIYQRLWEKTAVTKLATGDNTDATIQETRWSKRFNALAYAYGKGEGYSLWVDPDDSHDEMFTFRLPKTHTAYNYYNEVTEEPMTLEESGLTRANAFRFAYEADLTPTAYTYLTDNDRQLFANIGELSVTLTAEAATQTFLVGNPFMSHINVQAFLEANEDVVSEVKTYNGNTHNSAIAVAGQYITTDETFTTIKPMEAFFVTAKNAGTTLTVVFNESMFGNAVRAQQPSPTPLLAETSNEVGMLRICASTESSRARALIVTGLDDTDRETLFDDEVQPQLAVFTIDNGKSLDINSHLADNIELGVYVSQESNVTLAFLAAGNISLADYELIDRQTGATYSLNEEVSVLIGESSINRFVLHRRGAATMVTDMNHESTDIVLTWREGAVTATAQTAKLQRMEVYSYDGVLLAQSTLVTPARHIGVKMHEQHAVVRVTEKNGQQREWKF
ncbi:MAG: hypothetical protein J6I60_06145 [Bacteroidaceae bacterium]|nr:hypothetical protein [Bacteroidaceae bacterium]